MFVREWGGTEQGCLVNKIDNFSLFTTSSKQVVMSVIDYDSYINSKSKNNKNSSYNKARNLEPCMAISMKPAKS